MGEHWWLLESGRWLRLLVLRESVSSAPHSWLLTGTACNSCLENKVLYIIMNLRCPLQCGPSDEWLGNITSGKGLPWSGLGHEGSRRLLSSLWYPTRASPSQWSIVTVHKNYLSSCIKQLTLRDFCFLLVTW